LLRAANQNDAWIIEDDYDGEFRYDGRPLPTLKSADNADRVIYIGTFSKILFPSLRVGYMVMPRDLVNLFESVRFAMDIFPSYLHQDVLADFMALGHLGRYVRKLRQIYSERRNVLIESIRHEFGDFLQVQGTAAGMHVSVTLPDGIEDTEIALRASAQRLLLWPLSRYYTGKNIRHGFVLGFGSTPTEQIPRSVKHMRVLIEASARSYFDSINFSSDSGKNPLPQPSFEM